MANYEPEYPANIAVDAGIKNFITNFYTVSDTFGQNREWADFYCDDATLIMEKKEAIGKDGILSSFLLCFFLPGVVLWTKKCSLDILKVREGMWEKVAARKHTVFKVFPASFGNTGAHGGNEEVELMLYGSVVYKFKGEEGQEGGADWAGYAKLFKSGAGGEWKFAYYRVYIQR
ncbi:hypothetical protein BD289DRAFT_420254 [Coniella lustricola]|uniref:SnoaL-like domain-containing protein n=1 Tax=Coniella lustricola TaxID=2025994 RepID=A0A2T3AN30_9PEZI|nr:hypothetical protein BD289DRAFT_420254 [Coniella lustricola]